MPILLKGRRKVLELDDLYQPLEEHHADKLGTKLEKAWEEEVVKKRAKNKQPSLMSAGLKVFGFDIMFLGSLLLVFEMLFKVTMPIFLGGVVRYYANPERSDISEAYWYSAGIIACSLFSVCKFTVLTEKLTHWLILLGCLATSFNAQQLELRNEDSNQCVFDDLPKIT